MLQSDDHAPRLDNLVGVGRPQRDEAGDRAQRDELLDRLMRRTVLPEADRIVGEDDRSPAAPSARSGGWRASCSRKRSRKVEP